MTLQTVGVPALLTVIAVLVVFRARARVSRAGLLSVAVPLALVPAIGAITLAVWRIRWLFEEIGRTGSGGMARVLERVQESGQLMLGGAVAVLVVIGIASVLASRQAASVPSSGQSSRAAAPTLVLCCLAAFAAAAALAVVADREVVFFKEWLSSLAQLPAARPPSLAELGRLLEMSTIGGPILALGIVMICLVTGRLAGRLAPSSNLLAGAWSLAAGLALAAGVQAWHLAVGLSRLGAIVAK